MSSKMIVMNSRSVYLIIVLRFDQIGRR